ncbi:hypothetical protein [Methylobacterium sp. R2-1]|uniref:hypothetical protein n=1 Tax=Methylobacterium sp. R2-1 TaxID=2587064 RepID=UPI001622ADD0|nr:hypothetical protein [Methylobacterium sp. R2-1]MBB2961922.1 hypothetical protein [Methylobacterium sp. R2-1]
MAVILGDGWELLVVRRFEQARKTPRGEKIRTVGTYEVYHDGVRQADPSLQGQMAESRGPGANRPRANGKRVAEGRYALATQGTPETKYHTFEYDRSERSSGRPKPGFEITVPGPRTGILVHPGTGFLASVGCLNPCTNLPDETENIDYAGSRRRVIALIDDMAAFLGRHFPSSGELFIPRGFAVIDGEP